MTETNSIKLAQRKMIMEALDDLYIKCDSDDLSTLTLKLNFNPYNMGHKITTTHHNIGYAKQYPNPNDGESNP